MKSIRQQKILEIIGKYKIETQEELVEYLKKEGISVTQATISRDIRELRLQKKSGSEQGFSYGQKEEPSSMPEDKYIRVLKDSFISMDTAMNILVIKTASGMAMAAAAALDACSFHEIVGCIAGDDTIMCAVRSIPETAVVKKKIETIIE